MPDWISLVFLGFIVLFWAIVFFTALFLTRRSLRGVGELTAEETAGHGELGANGRTAPAKSSGSSASASSAR